MSSCAPCVCGGSSGKDKAVVLRAHTFWLELHAFIQVVLLVLMLTGVGFLVVNASAIGQGVRNATRDATDNLTTFGAQIQASVADATAALARLEDTISGNVGSVLSTVEDVNATVAAGVEAAPGVAAQIADSVSAFQTAVQTLSQAVDNMPAGGIGSGVGT